MFYQWTWYPLLLLLAALTVGIEGRTTLLRHRALPALLLWSAPVWLLFEAANFRLTNWYYVFVPESRPVRWIGGLAAFATVMPALYLASRILRALGFAGGWHGPPFRLRNGHLRAARLAGVAFLGLVVWKPSWFFPLIWGAFTLLLEPGNYRRDPGQSLLGDLSAGRYARFARLLVAGAIIGLAWESFNFLAGARWIYTVPGLETLKLFEMPLPGFLGFPVLALDCFVIYQALVGLGLAPPAWFAEPDHASPDRRSDSRAVRSSGRASDRGERRTIGTADRVAAATTALVFCVAVLAGIDHWSVDSYRPRVRDLPGVTPAVVQGLGASGAESVYAIADLDSTTVAARTGLTPRRAGALVRAAQLAELRGIGTRNAAALMDGGIDTVCELGAAAQPAVTEAVRRVRHDPYAGRATRVRVWRRAAATRCASVIAGVGPGRHVIVSIRSSGCRRIFRVDIRSGRPAETLCQAKRAQVST